MSPSTSLCVLNSKGVILFTSQGWKDFLLTSSSPYASLLQPGLDVLSLEALPPTDSVAFLQAGVQAVLAGEKLGFNYEYAEKVVQGIRTVRIEIQSLHSPVDGCQILVEDVSARQVTENLREGFFVLKQKIAEISSRFLTVTSQNLNENIERALREVCTLAGADYSFLSRLAPDGRTTSMTNYWHPDPPQGFRDSFQKVPIESNPYADQLVANQVISVPSLDCLPPRAAEYRKACERQKVKAIVVVPISVDDSFSAYVGLVSLRSERDWSEREQMLLRVLAEIFGAAFHRVQVETNLRDKEKSVPAPELREETPYRNSSLTADEIRASTERLVQVMRQERPYLDSNFNLARLAKFLRLPEYQVSQVLSVGLQTGFYDLVNRYRIEKLTQLMISPAYDKISILDLAYRVGFNSKSSFNLAFKKITGTTPSRYREEKRAARQGP